MDDEVQAILDAGSKMLRSVHVPTVHKVNSTRPVSAAPAKVAGSTRSPDTESLFRVVRLAELDRVAEPAESSDVIPSHKDLGKLSFKDLRSLGIVHGIVARSRVDLLAKFNYARSGARCTAYDALRSNPDPIPIQAELESLNLTQLNAIANQHDVTKGNNNAVMLNRLQHAREGTQPESRECTGCGGRRRDPVFDDDIGSTCRECNRKGQRSDAKRIVNQERRDHSKKHMGSAKNKLRDIKHHAQQRGIPFLMTDDVAIDMITSQCTYCGKKASGDEVIAIDRKDNDGPYDDHINSTPCCGRCNIMKGCLDTHTFLERVHHITSVHNGGSALYPDAWPGKMPSSTYTIVKARAKKQGIAFTLTPTQFESICARPCTFCHAPPCSTVDKVDNEREYSVRTTQPLCLECNFAKSDMLEAEFFAHCQRIVGYGALGIITTPTKRCLFQKGER
jgi:hypothetical protein